MHRTCLRTQWDLKSRSPYCKYQAFSNPGIPRWAPGSLVTLLAWYIMQVCGHTYISLGLLGFIPLNIVSIRSTTLQNLRIISSNLHWLFPRQCDKTSGFSEAGPATVDWGVRTLTSCDLSSAVWASLCKSPWRPPGCLPEIICCVNGVCPSQVQMALEKQNKSLSHNNVHDVITLPPKCYGGATGHREEWGGGSKTSGTPHTDNGDSSTDKGARK